MKKFLIPLVFTLVSTSAVASQNINTFKPENQQSLTTFAAAVINDEIDIILKGGGSPLMHNVMQAEVSTITNDYKSNELSANKKYNQKPVRVKSIASSIRSDISGNAFIAVGDRYVYGDIRLYVDPDDKDILSLSKGSEIDFICRVASNKFSTPSFRNCLFTKDYSGYIGLLILSAINKASNINYKPTFRLEALILIMYKLKSEEIDSKCSSDFDTCKKSIDKIIINPPSGIDAFKENIEKELKTFEALPVVPDVFPDKNALSKMFDK